MNKFFIALIAVLTVANASFLPKEDEAMFAFTRFITQHNKEYSSVSEFEAKFEIFRENLAHQIPSALPNRRPKGGITDFFTTKFSMDYIKEKFKQEETEKTQRVEL